MTLSSLVPYHVLVDHISTSACEHILIHISSNDHPYINKLLIEKTGLIIDRISKDDAENTNFGFYMPFKMYELMAITDQKSVKLYSFASSSSDTALDNSSTTGYVQRICTAESTSKIFIAIINVIWFLSGNGNVNESGGLRMHDGTIIPAKACSVVCCIRGWCFPVSVISPTESKSPPLLFVVVPLYHII